MKKIYLLLFSLVLISNIVFSQSSSVQPNQTFACIAQVVANSTQNICFGNCKGVANCFPGGGTAPYTFVWSPGGQTTSGISNLCAGTYTISVTDFAGSKCSASCAITTPTQLVAGTTSNSISVSCSGKCDAVATVSATGGTGSYTYSWFPGGETTPSVSGLCAVPYGCTVIDANGCKVTITVTPNSPAPLNVTTTTGVNSATANPTGGTIPYTYSWNPTGQTTQTATGLSAGSYTVTVTDKNGCTKIAIASVTTGVNNLSEDNSIKIYPNPISKYLMVELTTENSSLVKITLTNILGETLYEESLTVNKLLKKSIDTSKLNSGVYFINVKTSNKTITQKIVKE